MTSDQPVTHNPAYQDDDDGGPCWELDAAKDMHAQHPKWPLFCASAANGRPRCKKGTCFLTEPKQLAL